MHIEHVHTGRCVSAGVRNVTDAEGTTEDLEESGLVFQMRVGHLLGTVGSIVYQRWAEALAEPEVTPNRAKTKHRIARLHQRMARMRADFPHKLSTRWSNRHALIVLEEPRIGDMTRSAQGTVQEPGHNVAAKSGLHRSILDQGWDAFATMLEYKLSAADASCLSPRTPPARRARRAGMSIPRAVAAAMRFAAPSANTASTRISTPQRCSRNAEWRPDPNPIPQQEVAAC